jgi:ankyrin repeat protein
MFNDLPNGLYAIIIKYLKMKHIFKLSKTCIYINQIISNDIIIIHNVVSKIINKQTNKFYKNKKYDLLKMKMEKFFKKCKINNIIKYILDNAITLECKDDLGLSPIHHICRYCDPEIIKYIINKNIDLDCINDDQYKSKPYKIICIDNDQYQPIHYICQYSTPDILKYFIDKFKQLNNTDIYIEPYTYDLKTPLCIAISQNNNEMVNILLDNIDNFNYYIELDDYAECCEGECYSDTDDINNNNNCNCNVDVKGKKHILHHACQSDLNNYIVQKMFAKYENLDFVDNTGWHTSHYICFYMSYDLIKYALDIKKINMNKTLFFDASDFCDKYPSKYNCIDLIAMNKKLTNVQKKELILQIYPLLNKKNHYNSNNLIDILIM